MAKLRVIVAASVFCGLLALGNGLIAQQRPGAGANVPGGNTPIAPTIRGLIEARIAVAKDIFEMSLAPAQNAPLEDLPAWSRHWMDDQVALDSDPRKQLAAIQDHLNRLKGLEEMAEARHQAARGGQATTLKMKYARLEAEQMLAEIRIINPALSQPKPAAKR